MGLRQKIEQKPVWRDYQKGTMQVIPQWLWRFLEDEEKWFLEFQKRFDGLCEQLKQLFENELLEKLAELEHEQWSHWVDYQDKKIKPVTDMTMDEWYKQQETWRQWKKLSQTPYPKLTEKEKKSDREWARKAGKLVLSVVLELVEGKK